MLKYNRHCFICCKTENTLFVVRENVGKLEIDLDDPFLKLNDDELIDICRIIPFDENLDICKYCNDKNKRND